MPTKKKSEEWTARLFLVAIGVYIIAVGPATLANWVVGLPLSLGPLLESRDFRLVLKITVNRVSGKEVFQIQEVRDSTIFQGGIHYHEAPARKEPPQPREPEIREAEWDIDEEFDLEGGEYQEIPMEMKAGNRLVGLIEADGKVSAYLLGASSLRSFDQGSGFNYYWGKEDPVTRTKVSAEALDTRTYHFVVSNGYEDEDGDDNDAVSVEVKLRVED